MPGARDRDILDLFARLKRVGVVTSAKHRELAVINEKAVHGDQFGSMAYKNGTRVTSNDDWYSNGDEEIPRIVVNKLMNMRMVWVALLNKSRLSAAAFPSSDEPEDTYSAAVADKVIEHAVTEEDTAEKVHTLTGQCFDHGTSAFKVWFDVDEKKTRIGNASIFDYLIDNVADYREAKWVLFERWMDAEDAADEWSEAGIDGEPATGTQDTATGEKVEGRVQCWELWQKPTRAFKRGLFAFIVGGEVVEQMDFPYVFEDDSGEEQFVLPIFIAKTRQVRGSAYGGTNLTDAVPLQRLVNELVSRELEVTRKTSGVHAWIPRDAPEDWDPAVDSVMHFDEGKGQAPPQFLQPPPVNPTFERQRTYFEEQIVDVIGINEVTAGDTTTARSGVAQEQIFELDQAKNADASKSIEQAVLAMFQMYLRLVAKFYDVGRKMKITGDGKSDIVMFDGADIQGVDVRLESSSELDKRNDVKRAATEGKMAAGTATQHDLDVASNAPSVGISKRVVQALIAQYLAGKTVDDPRPGVDFSIDVFHDEIDKAKAKALASGSKQDWVALHKLATEVERLQSEQGDAAPPAAAPVDDAAPPPDPNAPPPVPEAPPQ